MICEAKHAQNSNDVAYMYMFACGYTEMGGLMRYAKRITNTWTDTVDAMGEMVHVCMWLLEYIGVHIRVHVYVWLRVPRQAGGRHMLPH